jgi:hypothetical protein
MINGTDAPTHYTSDDVKNVGENHFRLNLGMGFGLDIVLLYSSSLAFRSFDGNLLDLKSTDKWPGDLFNPVVGQA